MVAIPYNKNIMDIILNKSTSRKIDDLIKRRNIAKTRNKEQLAMRLDIAIKLIFLRSIGKGISISQCQFAKALKISQKNVSQWENAQVTPTIKSLQAIANFYDTSIENILTPYDQVMQFSDEDYFDF